LRSRTPFNSLLLRLRSHSIARLTNFFASQDFVQTHPPIITSSDCEGAGEVFTVSTDTPRPAAPEGGQITSYHDELFFRDPKYLTVSSQLHLEALAQSVGKVWTLSPTFRAEKSDTARHLSEFYMLEAELSFVNHLDNIMDLVEDMLRDLAVSLQETKIGQEILMSKRGGESGEGDMSVTADMVQRRWQGLADGPWPRITYAQALECLQQAESTRKAKFEFPPSSSSGLQAEHEKFLAEEVGQGSPVFVTDYPRAIKPFYMAPSDAETLGKGANAQEPTVACFDLLMPEICEVVGGSMREYRLPELLKSMELHGLIKSGKPSNSPLDGPASEAAVSQDEEDFGSLKWYTDLRRWGSVPHGGFGLGFDRLLGYLAGVPNIREVVTFPRWVGRCDC